MLSSQRKNGGLAVAERHRGQIDISTLPTVIDLTKMGGRRLETYWEQELPTLRFTDANQNVRILAAAALKPGWTDTEALSGGRYNNV